MTVTIHHGVFNVHIKWQSTFCFESACVTLRNKMVVDGDLFHIFQEGVQSFLRSSVDRKVLTREVMVSVGETAGNCRTNVKERAAELMLVNITREGD